jgi:hypothetical protein
LASRRLLAGALAVTALVAAGCGSDDGDGGGTATSAPTPAPSTNAAPTVSVPTPTATAPATRPGTVESQPGGAGDEQPAVVPATFKIDGNAIAPPDVAVPAFFTIRVTGQSSDGQAHTIGFQGQSVKIPPAGKASFEVEGLRAGIYPVTIDGREGAATITTGQDAGP